MKWTLRAGGLCAAILAGPAAAADHLCQATASDWPGEMSVTIRTDGNGRPKEASSRLQLGGKAVQLPMISVEYEMAGPTDPKLGDITYILVGAMVAKEQAPKSKSAEIVLTVDAKQAWSRPWGMYAQQDWNTKGRNGSEVAGFFGMIPVEARDSGLGKAVEAGQFITVIVQGVEAKETFGHRQQALARRDALQTLADAAHAAAMAKLPDYRKACKSVGN